MKRAACQKARGLSRVPSFFRPRLCIGCEFEGSSAVLLGTRLCERAEVRRILEARNWRPRARACFDDIIPSWQTRAKGLPLHRHERVAAAAREMSDRLTLYRITLPRSRLLKLPYTPLVLIFELVLSHVGRNCRFDKDLLRCHKLSQRTPRL